MKSLPIRAKMSLVIVLSCSLTLLASLVLQVVESWRGARSEHF